jgi:hypothetical protein
MQLQMWKWAFCLGHHDKIILGMPLCLLMQETET